MKLHYAKRTNAIYCWNNEELMPVWDEHVPDKPVFGYLKNSNLVVALEFEPLDKKIDGKLVYRIRIAKPER